MDWWHAVDTTACNYRNVHKLLANQIAVNVANHMNVFVLKILYNKFHFTKNRKWVKARENTDMLNSNWIKHEIFAHTPNETNWPFLCSIFWKSLHVAKSSKCVYNMRINSNDIRVSHITTNTNHVLKFLIPNSARHSIMQYHDEIFTC